jgi:hypothetical protein
MKTPTPAAVTPRSILPTRFVNPSAYFSVRSKLRFSYAEVEKVMDAYRKPAVNNHHQRVPLSTHSMATAINKPLGSPPVTLTINVPMRKDDPHF